MTNYKPLRFFAGGVEQFVVADPRVDALTAGGSASPALLHARSLLAQSEDESVMIWVGGSSTAAGGASTGAKRFGDRLLATLQARYPSGLGTETGVVTDANTPDATLGIHMVNRGGSSQRTPTSSTGPVSANADIAVYMWGSNDVLDGLSAAGWETKVRSLIESVDSAASKQIIHILGNHQPRLVWTDGTTQRSLWEAYREAMFAIASDMPDTVLVINASATFETLWRNGDTSAWSGDDIHLGDSGNAVLADIYARSLLA